MAGPPSKRQEVSAVVERFQAGALGLNQAESRLAYLGEDEWAAHLLCSALRGEGDPRRRGELMELLAGVAVPGLEVESALARGLVDDELGTRMAAIRGLARAQVRLAAPRIEAALDDPRVGLRREAAKALGALRVTRAAAPLLKRLAVEVDLEARVLMLGALGRVASKRDWPSLERFLESDSESTRLAAAHALCLLQAPSGFAFAKKLLAAPERLERAQGVRLYEEVARKPTARALEPLLGDSTALVRALAARVLVQAGDVSKLDWLVLESAKAQGLERAPYEEALEQLKVSDEQRVAILRKAGL
jgi:HEAT repeat protein